MTMLSYSRFINFWRNLYQKFDKLSLGKQLGLILIAIIVIWQAVCFVQGAITARAMNYYCEKEAGIKLAEGTYFMEVPEEEYEKNCDIRKNSNLSFYCLGRVEEKREWVDVFGSVKRDFSFGQRADKTSEGYIPYDIGGLIKSTKHRYNAKNNLLYTEVDYTVNAKLRFADDYSYHLFKKSLNNLSKGKSCGFNRYPSSSLRLDRYNLYVNKN